jgi:hypothetical protein
MTEPFAAYLRTSTEDNQSPEDSRRWQLALANQLTPRNRAASSPSTTTST